MAFEQPLKKRRRYEMFMSDGEVPGKLSPITPAAEPEILQHVKQQESKQAALVREFGTDEKMKKKRNREEIGNLYTAYRRLKFCLARQDETYNFDLKEEMEVAYYSMLELSSGCMSVRRIAAELIPRYAVFCPSALEAASQATLQLCDWSSSMVWQHSDLDGIASETAEACFSGLVHLSAAAVTAAPEQSAMGVTCTAVCRNVALYLLRQLNGRDLLAPVIKGTAVAKPMVSRSDRLVRLVSLSLCRVFSVDPEGVLAACFDLLRAVADEQRQDGLHFIAQIMKPIDGDIPALPFTAEGRVLEPPVSIEEPKLELMEQEGQPGSLASTSSLLAKVVHPKPALERWLASAVRHFRRSVSPEQVAEVLPLLFSLLKSLSTFSLLDFELEVEVKEDDKAGKHRCRFFSSSHVKLKESPDSREEWVRFGRGDQLSAAREEHWADEDYGNGVNREGVICNVDESPDANGFGAQRGVLNETEKFCTEEAKAWGSQETDQANGIAREDISVDESMLGGWKQGRSGDGRELEDPLPGDFESCSKSRSSNGGSRKDPIVSGLLLSPQQLSTPPLQASSSSPGWYSDGDPAAMDIFAASQHLWVGSLGPGVIEAQLRFHFEKFGSLEGVSLFRSRDFALVEFQSVRDAVKAREVLQGSMTWGRPLHIKFMDAGLGSRGTMGGVAVGGSCHVWAGGISSQNAKEELLKDVTGAGLKGPRSVYVLVSASAVLLEFEAPEEAAAVMVHIRQRRKEGVGYVFPSKIATEKSASAGALNLSSGEGSNPGTRHLWIGRIDASIREEELLSSFSKFGDLTGWKFIRTSGCCFIDFRQPECAALAKAQLNGTRFGIQCIVVEYKNTPQNRTSSVPLLSSPPHAPGLVHSPPLGSSGSRFGGSASLTAALNALQGKLLACAGTGVIQSRSRSCRGGGREGTERVPTNTLWIGLPDVVGPTFMNESELKNIFSLAAAGVGVVTKVRSARTSRGPCRFVEFDHVEAAASALRNVSGRLDSSIQIEFSNSAISMQQNENSLVHAPSNLGHTHVSLDDTHRRAWDYRERERHVVRTRDPESDEISSSTGMDFEESGSPSADIHPVFPPGWAPKISDKDVVDDVYRMDSRSKHESKAELQEDIPKEDSGPAGLNLFGGFRGCSSDLSGLMHDSPVLSSHNLLGKKLSLDRQMSTGGSMTRPPLPPPGATLARLPTPKHPPWLHLDRILPTTSWSGNLIPIPSSPLAQVSPISGMKSVLGGPPLATLPYGGPKVVQCRAPLLQQAPVTPGLCNIPLPPQPLDHLGQPIDLQGQSMPQPVPVYVVHHQMGQPLDHVVQPLEPLVPHGDHLGHMDLLNPPLPPMPPVSPPPPPPCDTPPPLSPSLPPPPSSPPPPLPPPPTDSLPEVGNEMDGHTLRERHWRGPLCKSGMQYCQILAFHQDSAACHYDRNFREPIDWPTKLDVTKRADFKSVKNTFNSTPLSQREVCRLFVSSGAENIQGFQQFISYLKQRERAGVVKIGTGTGMWPRMLYILPWSSEACALLSISPQPTNCLIGLMLPSLATFGGD